MKLWSPIPILSAVSSLALLTGCTSVTNVGPASSTESVTITPQVTSLPAGSTTTFTATVSGSSQVAGFSVAYANLADVGTITSSGSNSVVYKAPAKPPIYPGVFPPSSQQGTIILQAAFSAGAFSPVGTSETITITAPSVTAGISPATITVALGGTAQSAAAPSRQCQQHRDVAGHRRYRRFRSQWRHFLHRSVHRSRRNPDDRAKRLRLSRLPRRPHQTRHGRRDPPLRTQEAGGSLITYSQAGCPIHTRLHRW